LSYGINIPKLNHKVYFLNFYIYSYRKGISLLFSVSAAYNLIQPRYNNQYQSYDKAEEHQVD
jgi:hypothetical protein